MEVKGAHLWSWTRKSLLPVYQGVGVDPELVQEGRQALVSYFQSKGFFDVNVDSQFHKQDSVDTIVYTITKGKKHKVTDVSVAGNSQLKTPDLMALVTVKKSHLFSPGQLQRATGARQHKESHRALPIRGIQQCAGHFLGEPQGWQPGGGLPRSRGAAGYCELAQD